MGHRASIKTRSARVARSALVGFACLFASGCSLALDFDGDVEADRDAAMAADAAAASDAPASLGPWQNIRPVTELNSASADLKISFTADGLDALFDSDRGGNRDIFMASRGSLAEPFGQPTVVAELATLTFDGHPGISDDGLQLFFARNSGGPTSSDLFESSRVGRDQPWGAPVIVSGLSSAAPEDGPDISADGSLLVFSGSPAGSRDLFSAMFVDGAWVITELAELNTDEGEFDPDLSADLLEIHFARISEGASVIMRATRADVESPFGAPAMVAELGVAAGPRMSGDRRTMYFHRTTLDGGVDLFVADR